MTDDLWYALRNAIYAGDFAAAEDLLSQNPSLPTLRNGIGETVLHFLAVENRSEGVAWLHSRGFSLNEKNRFGTPMIFEVACLEYRDLFIWFVEQGADLTATDGEGDNIVGHLRESGKENMAEFVIATVPNINALSIAAKAEYYRLGLILNLVDTSDIIAWADNLIEQSSTPDPAIIDLSWSRSLDEISDAIAKVADPKYSEEAGRRLLGIVKVKYLSEKIRLHDATGLAARIVHEADMDKEIYYAIDNLCDVFEMDDEEHPKFIECRNDFVRLLERESLG
jgi:hypothetical protein